MPGPSQNWKLFRFSRAGPDVGCIVPVVTASSQARGPYAKTAGRVEHILRATTELFAITGYRAATMKDIAQRAGMSQTGLMHHFPTKVELLIAVLQRQDEQDEMLAELDDGIPPIERLVALATQIKARPAVMALYAVLSAEATAPDHPAHDYFVDRYERLRCRTTDAFAALRDSGRLRPGTDPAILCRMLLALLDGLQLQWLLDSTSVDLEAEVRVFVTAFLVAD